MALAEINPGRGPAIAKPQPGLEILIGVSAATGWAAFSFAAPGCVCFGDSRLSRAVTHHFSLRGTEPALIWLNASGRAPVPDALDTTGVGRHDGDASRGASRAH